MQRQAWRVEDEREMARLAAIREQRLQADQRDVELQQRREVEMELRLQELERQLQLGQVARERVVRRTQQDAAFMKEVSGNMQRKRHDLTVRSERREHAIAIAEERRFQRTRLEEQQHLANRETNRWRLDLETKKEQLSDEQGEQARRDYEVRTKQLQAEDGDHDAQAEVGLRAALRNAEEARWLDDAQEFQTAHSGRQLLGSEGSPRRRQASASGPADAREASPAGRASSANPVSAEAQVLGPSLGTEPAGPAHGGSGLPEAGALRERELEDLIRRREAELEALWRDFDREAQQVSEDEEHAVFLGPARPAADEHTGASSAPAPLASRTRTRHSPGGPLAGAWGDTSEDSSSGSEAFRRLGSKPPGAAGSAEPGRFLPPRRRGGGGHDQWEKSNTTSAFDDKAWASESDVS